MGDGVTVPHVDVASDLMEYRKMGIPRRNVPTTNDPKGRGSCQQQGGMPSRYCNPNPLRMRSPQCLIGRPFEHSHASEALTNPIRCQWSLQYDGHLTKPTRDGTFVSC